MNAVTRDILMNREVIAVNQDPLGRQGYHVGSIGHGGEVASVWAKPLEDGSVAGGPFNPGERDARLIVVGWESVGLHDQRPCWRATCGRIKTWVSSPATSRSAWGGTTSR